MALRIEAISNRAGNTTTNISNRGVRKTQNNKGWLDVRFWSYKQKKQPKQKQSSFNWTWSANNKKSKSRSFDSAAFASNVENIADRFEKSKANSENWTKGEWTAFIIIVTIACIIIQLW